MKKNLTRAPLALAGALVLSVAALSGCGVESGRSQSGDSGSTSCPWKVDKSIDSSVKIGWQRVPNGDLIVQDQKILENCMPNAKITWTAYDSGAKVVQAYAAKDVDLALIGNSPSTTAMSPPNGLGVDVVWIHDVIGKAESLIAKDSSIKSVEDLKGKTVGTPFGSTAHYSLLQAISDAGLSPSDVKVINLEPDAMPASWKSGGVDAVWVWQPTLSQLTSQGGTTVTSSAETAKAGYPTYDLGTASTDFVEANPEFMDQWAKAQNYAVDMIKNDPDKAAQTIAAVLAIKPADVKSQLEGYTFLDAKEQVTPKWLGGQIEKDLVNTAKFLKQQGSIDKELTPAEYAEHVDAAPAQSAAK